MPIHKLAPNIILPPDTYATYSVLLLAKLITGLEAIVKCDHETVSLQIRQSGPEPEDTVSLLFCSLSLISICSERSRLWY